MDPNNVNGLRDTTKPPRQIWHDWEVHHPLGAGSYIFSRSFITALLCLAQIPEDGDVLSKPVILHAGYQPNDSPHIGTITVFALAFQVAQELKRARSGNLEVTVHLDEVDTAPDSREKADVGKGYQRSLRYTGAHSAFHSDYVSLFDKFSKLSSIPYTETNQADLMRSNCIPTIVREIVKSRQNLAPRLSPDTGKLALRVACPTCGISDKHGIFKPIRR